jgi:hypothetical protein
VTVAIKPAKTKTKGAGNGRNLGKLAQLIDMPLDVFFEARLFLGLPFLDANIAYGIIDCGTTRTS